jgi:hypothetical protein
LSFIQNALEKAQRLRGKTQKDLGGTAQKVSVGEDLEPRWSDLGGGGQEWEEVPKTEIEGTVLQKEEMFNQEAMGIKLLTDAGRQVQRFTVIGLLFLTLNTLFLGVSTILLIQTYRDRDVLLQIAQEMLPAKISGGVVASGAEKTSQAGMLVAKTPVPTVKYVGSITSNKYHYPSCKWAKSIKPKKVRVFSSVAEAKRSGYRVCPSCKPPLSDTPD